MISARHALGWILATALVTLAAWWVVAEASGEVNETAGAPLVVPTTSSSVDTGTSSLPDSTSSSLPGSTTTSLPGSTTTSQPTTTTTAPTVSSTSPTTVPSGVETISSAGGTVTVSYGNGEVHLQGASPAFGYSVEIEGTGPDEVRVDFEAEESEVSVRVKWTNNSLDIEIKD